MGKYFSKVLILIFLILSNIFISSASDISSIYNEQISKLETQMNNAVKQLEENYNKQIERMKTYLEQAKRNLTNQEDIASRQASIAVSRAQWGWVVVSESMAESIYNDTYRKFESNIDSARNQVITLESQLNDLINNENTEINKIKSQYQQQIEELKEKKNNANDSINNSNNNYYNNSFNNSNNSCWLNSYLTSYWKCDCNIWYFWEDLNNSKNFNCIKQTNTQMCQETYWIHSYWDKNYCYCNTWYTWNSNKTLCIKEVIKTPTELCQADFWITSYSDGSKTKNWEYNCFCKSWYDWNANNTSCIRTITKLEDINLSDNYKKQIEKSFSPIKIKLQQLPVWKREQQYEKVGEKIDNILWKQTNERVKNILLYLRFLIDTELKNIDNEEIDLSDLFGDLFSEDFKCWNNISVKWYTYTTKIMPDWKCWTTTNMKHIPNIWKSYCYNWDEKNCDKYWGLYNLEWAVGACIMLWNWWKLPTLENWKELINKGATGWKWNKIFWIWNTLWGTAFTDWWFWAINEFWFYSIASDNTEVISLNWYLNYLRVLEWNLAQWYSVTCIQN